MAEEIIFNTRVNTGNTANDVDDVTKSLQGTKTAASQVSKELEIMNSRSEALQETLSTLEKGTPAFEKVQSELNQLNEDIEKVTAGATLLDKKFDDIYGDVQPLTGRIGELEDRLYELAAAGERDSQVFKDISAEVTRLKMVVQEVDKEIDAASTKGANLQAAFQLGETVVAGYGALQGTMALLGQDSEQFEETLVKLQAAQTLLTSIEQIRLATEKESFLMQKVRVVWTNLQTGAYQKQLVSLFSLNGLTALFTTIMGGATTAFAAFNAIVAANPLLALIALLTAAAAAVAYFASESDHAAEDNEKLNKSIERQNELLEISNEKMVRNANNRLKQAQAEGASEDVLLEKRLAVLKAEETARERNMSEIQRQIKQRLKILTQAIAEQDTETGEAAKKEIEELQKKYRKLKALDGQYYASRKAEITQFNTQQRKQAEEEAKKNSDEAQKAAEAAAQKAKERREKLAQQEREAAQKKLEYEKLITDLSIANIEDEWQRRFALLALNQKRERDELIAKYGNDTKLIAELEKKQQNELLALDEEQRKQVETKEAEEEKARLQKENENRKAQLEGELIQMRDDFDSRMELQEKLAKLERDQALQNKELTEGEKFKIDQQYKQKIDELNKEKVENEERTNQAIIASRQALGNAVAGLAGQVAGLLKEGSAAQKTAALTELAINTAIGFVNGLRIAQQAAIATGPGAALAFPIFYAQQLTAVLAAAKQAKTILKGGGSVSAPSSSAGSSSSGGLNSNPLGSNSTTNTQQLQDNQKGKGSVLVLDSFKKVYEQDQNAIDVATVQ